MTPYFDDLPRVLRDLADEVQKQRGPSLRDLIFLAIITNQGKDDFNISFRSDYEDYGNGNDEINLRELIRECVRDGSGELSARDGYISAITKLRDDLNSMIASLVEIQ